MRFMHISDLHLGKKVYEYSMMEDQEYILIKIVNIIDREKPDALLVAGDVFDRSIPSEEAVKLWDDFLGKLAQRHIPVLAISGNHDSAVRFADHSSLIQATGIYLSPAYDGESTCITLEDSHGPVHIYLLPFLKPAHVKAFYPEEEISDYTDACRVAVNHMNLDATERNILVAHQFVTGAVRSESEEITVGGLDNVDVSVFDEFDYVALGHIHGPQKIGRETVRYSGTPLKYSFSEKDHKKSVVLIDMEEKGSTEIRLIPLEPLRDLREIRGDYATLTGKDFYEADNTEDYIHAVLTDEEDVFEAMARLRVIYPNLMKVTYDNKRTRESHLVEDPKAVNQKSPMDLLSDFYEQQNNQPMSPEQMEFTRELIEKIWG